MAKPVVKIKKREAQQNVVRTAGALEVYIPLVHSIAAMIAGKGLPPNIDFNDLVSDGMIGLMKAWDNFDPKRGVKFETYASYRVRGEILDGLKYYNPVPYRIQVMIRDLAKKGYSAVLKKSGELEGLSAKEAKILEKKKMTEEEFKTAVSKIKRIVSASALMYLVSLDQVLDGSEIQVSGETTPVDEAEWKDLQVRLNEAVEALPVQEKKIMNLFYKKGINQKEIAKDLKLSRSKVNRVIARAIYKLREKLK